MMFGFGRAGSPSRPVYGLHLNSPRAARRSAPTNNLPVIYVSLNTHKAGLASRLRRIAGLDQCIAAIRISLSLFYQAGEEEQKARRHGNPLSLKRDNVPRSRRTRLLERLNPMCHPPVRAKKEYPSI